MEKLNEEKVILNGEEVAKEVVEELKESTAKDKNTTVVETSKNEYATRLRD